MLKILKCEIKRSFCNYMFFVSLIISGILVIWYSIERIPSCIEWNASFFDETIYDNFLEVSYTNWIGSHNIYLQQNILYLIIPFLAVLPFGSSFYMDINQGYIKGICTRTKKSYYLVSKYIAVFLSGGCAVVIPMILSFMISSSFLPTMLPETSYIFTNIYPIYKWADLFFVHPLLYTLLYIGVAFLFSGFIACLSLFITYFSNKNFLVLLFPFFIYIFSSLFFELLDLEGFSIRNILTTTGEQGTTLSVIILAISFFALSFFPYYFYGVKKDVL